jgi:hypothetical protein
VLTTIVPQTIEVTKKIDQLQPFPGCVLDPGYYFKILKVN